MEADGQMSVKMPKTMIETNEEYGAGRVEPEKEKNPNLEMMLIDDFNMDLLTPEDEASRKRKPSEMEADGQMSANMSKTMIETYQQFCAGRVEPEKEKNPPQENEGLRLQNHEKDSHQVEPEKEKNPQQENEGLLVQNQENVGEEVEEYVDRSAFNERLYTRQYKHRGSNDILQAGQQYKVRIMRLLDHYMKKNGSVTFFMVYQCKLMKYNLEDDTVVYTEVYFYSRNRRLISIQEFEENYQNAIDTINGKLGDYMGESSGWQIDSINAVNLNIAKYNAIRGASYIPTPSAIEVKKAVVNVRNNDMLCFAYSILAFKFPHKNNTSRVSTYKKHLDKLNYKDVEMPMAVDDIDRFEKKNGLVINVYSCNEDGREICPRRISKRRSNDAINLL